MLRRFRDLFAMRARGRPRPFARDGLNDHPAGQRRPRGARRIRGQFARAQQPSRSVVVDPVGH
eukprot:11161866-Lingulodinium_polyedra.AAC.1